MSLFPTFVFDLFLFPFGTDLLDSLVVKFNSPSVTEIDDVLSEYTSFGEDVISTKMSQIINEDVFQTARVNLNNLIF